MSQLHEQWKQLLDQEMQKEYMVTLKSFITERRDVCHVLPDSKQVFSAFTATNWDNLKVVIIGQDPYPTRADAHGIAFSSQARTTPYSLQNIFQEIKNDVLLGDTSATDMFPTNNLLSWCQQGVLLLNSCLTTEEGKPSAHKNKGWEIFTENTVKFINERHGCRLVWMLWGAQARKYKPFINADHHLILEADHPAAVKHNDKAWFGNKHFSKANNFIKKHYFNQRKPIEWQLCEVKKSVSDENAGIMDRCRQVHRAVVYHGIDSLEFFVKPSYDDVKLNLKDQFTFCVNFLKSAKISEELKNIIRSLGFTYTIKNES